MEDIATIVIVAGFILTLLNIWDKYNTAKQKIKNEGLLEARREVTFETDISAIRQGNAAIMVQLDKVDIKMDNYQERLVVVEQSTKQAHKRIDRLEVTK